MTSNLEYTGQSSAELLAERHTHPAGSILRALEWAIQAKQERKLGRLSPEERTVLSILALDREVNNGGFDQFFLNSSRRYAPSLVEHLTTIGARRTARLAARAIAARKDEAELDKLDQQYYRGHSTVIEAKLWQFVQRNQDTIQVPSIKVRSSRRKANQPAPVSVRAAAAQSLEDQNADLIGLLWEGKAKEALARARKLVRAHPQDSNCWDSVASALFKLDRHREGMEALERAIACNARDPYPVASACLHTAQRADWTACLEYATRGRGMNIAPAIRGMMLDEFTVWGARALHSLGRHQEALTWLARLDFLGDFLPASKSDPLLHPRRLAQACRAALRKAR